MILRIVLFVVFSVAFSVEGLAQNASLIGIDSNYALDMATRGKAWNDRSEPVDPCELFAKNGCQNARIRLWVGKDGMNRLTYATRTALRAKQAGLKPYLVIFLSDDWADLVRQPAPALWRKLSPEKKLAAVAAYIESVVSHIPFWQAMLAAEVRLDYPGLSYFPSSAKELAQRSFSFLRAQADKIVDALHKRVLICETGYPATANFRGQFAEWNRPAEGYPLSNDGQARWIVDLAAVIRADPNFAGVFYWSPEWYDGGLWDAFALFDEHGVARPGVRSFKPQQPIKHPETSSCRVYARLRYHIHGSECARERGAIPMGKLSDKVAVITGATSGMALATAKLFVSEGAYVFITGRRREKLDEAVKTIGRNVTAVQGDAADLADLDRLYETVRMEKGRIDVLFASAGTGDLAPIGEVTEEQFDRTFGLNVRGTLFTVQKALPLFADGGSIIMNGSIAGSMGFPAFGVYSASKAALRSFARTWTVDLKARHIRVNVLSPGTIDTPALEGAPKDAIDGFVALIPRGAMGRPEEIATAALFLASSDSSFVTGTELFVDGGVAQI